MAHLTTIFLTKMNLIAHFISCLHPPSLNPFYFVLLTWAQTIYNSLERNINGSVFSPLCSKTKEYRTSSSHNASVNSTCDQPPPGQLRGICPPCQSRGWGICKCCTARGPSICQPPGQSRAFDTHAASYQNITTKKVLLEEEQIGSFVKDRNKL